MSRIRYVKGRIIKRTEGVHQMYASENIVFNSGGEIAEFGEENGTSFNEPEKPPTPQTQSKVSIEFRPHSKYNGEFGFDWLRQGDIGSPGDIWYKSIVGFYFADATFKVKREQSDFFQPNLSEYNRLLSLYKPAVSIPWRKNDVVNFPEFFTLLKGKVAKFTLLLEIDEEPKEIIIKYNKNLFKLNNETIPVRAGKLTDYLTVECIKEFEFNQKIEVFAKTRVGKEFLAGRLIAIANDINKQRKVQVVFVNVTTNLTGAITKIGKSLGNETLLKKFMSQCLTVPEIQTASMDVSGNYIQKLLKVVPFTRNFITNDGARKVVSAFKTIADRKHDYGVSLESFLEGEFNKIHGGKYMNFYKVFYFDEPIGFWTKDGGTDKYVGLNGKAENVGAGARTVIISESGAKNAATTTHELLHCMGLHHTFNNNADFTYKKFKTENIMDYSHQKGVNRISTWLHQWKKINRSINS